MFSQLIDFSTHKRAYIIQTSSVAGDFIFYDLGVVDSALSDHILIIIDIQLPHCTHVGLHNVTANDSSLAALVIASWGSSRFLY